MKIIADENIARVDVFQALGDLICMPGRDINRDVLKNADALLVRSVTKVNEKLLSDSRLKFIASATSGIDHVFEPYLHQHNIAFAYAPACNARSVVEYVFSALASLSEKHGFDWRHLSFGIIGAGNIGGLLARFLNTLEIDFCIFDPFLNESSEHGDKLVSFAEAVQQDIISIHTPLTVEGEFPSHHLFCKEVIENMAAGKILINAARGSVLDNQALLASLKSGKELLCVLDAWENEPAVSLDLLTRVDITTPHIAGYSQDGKLRGTQMIYSAFCDFFTIEKKPSSILFGNPEINLAANSAANSATGLTSTDHSNIRRADKFTDLAQLNKTLLEAYTIEQDHHAMQALLTQPEPALGFDLLRKHYPVRLEYSVAESLPVY